MNNPKFIYSSSPDRGLDTLLYLFPFIRAEFPGATLDVFYGFENWSKSIAQSGNEQQRVWRDQILESLEQPGVTLRGKVDQQTLAKEMINADIWLYPTNFTETYCITALEAQLSGTVCICTDLAGLQATVGDRGILISGTGNAPAYTKEYRERALEAVFAILRDDERREALVKRGKQWATEQTWANRAREWTTHFGLTPTADNLS